MDCQIVLQNDNSKIFLKLRTCSLVVTFGSNGKPWDTSTKQNEQLKIKCNLNKYWGQDLLWIHIDTSISFLWKKLFPYMV